MENYELNLEYSTVALKTVITRGINSWKADAFAEISYKALEGELITETETFSGESTYSMSDALNKALEGAFAFLDMVKREDLYERSLEANAHETS